MGDDLVQMLTLYLEPIAVANGIEGKRHRPLADAIVNALRGFLTDDAIAAVFSSALSEREEHDARKLEARGPINCRSEEGEIVGLVDAAHTLLRMARRRLARDPYVYGIESNAIADAVEDLHGDPEIKQLLSYAWSNAHRRREAARKRVISEGK